MDEARKLCPALRGELTPKDVTNLDELEDIDDIDDWLAKLSAESDIETSASTIPDDKLSFRPNIVVRTEASKDARSIADTTLLQTITIPAFQEQMVTQKDATELDNEDAPSPIPPLVNDNKVLSSVIDSSPSYDPHSSSGITEGAKGPGKADRLFTNAPPLNRHLTTTYAAARKEEMPTLRQVMVPVIGNKQQVLVERTKVLDTTSIEPETITESSTPLEITNDEHDYISTDAEETSELVSTDEGHVFNDGYVYENVDHSLSDLDLHALTPIPDTLAYELGDFTQIMPLTEDSPQTRTPMGENLTLLSSEPRDNTEQLVTVLKEREDFLGVDVEILLHDKVRSALVQLQIEDKSGDYAQAIIDALIGMYVMEEYTFSWPPEDVRVKLVDIVGTEVVDDLIFYILKDDGTREELIDATGKTNQFMINDNLHSLMGKIALTFFTPFEAALLNAA